MLKACGGLFMRGKSYTFFIASSPGKLRKVIVPAYVLHGIAVLAIIGAISVTAAVGSYSRMLWRSATTTRFATIRKPSRSNISSSRVPSTTPTSASILSSPWRRKWP